MKMPWEMRLSEFISFEDTMPKRSSAYVRAKSASEEDIHFASWKNRALETTPPEVKRLALGVWTNRYHCVEQLRFIPIRSLRRFEESNIHLVRKYANWLEQGSLYPAISVTEGRYQNLLLTDGHHRVAALEMLGIPFVYAWVSISLYERFKSGDIYCRPASYHELVLLAIRNGIAVQNEVLEDALIPEFGELLGDFRDQQYWVMTLSGCEPDRSATQIETLARMRLIDYRWDEGTYFVKLTELGRRIIAQLEVSHV